MGLKEIKIKVYKLQSNAPSMFLKDYSKDIEQIVNTHQELIYEDKSYSLSNFKIIHVEENPYVVLKYERGL